MGIPQVSCRDSRHEEMLNGRGLGNLCTSHGPSPGASRHPLPVGEGWSRESILPVGEGARRADEGGANISCVKFMTCAEVP